MRFIFSVFSKDLHKKLIKLSEAVIVFSLLCCKGDIKRFFSLSYDRDALLSI